MVNSFVFHKLYYCYKLWGHFNTARMPNCGVKLHAENRLPPKKENNKKRSFKYYAWLRVSHSDILGLGWGLVSSGDEYKWKHQCSRAGAHPITSRAERMYFNQSPPCGSCEYSTSIFNLSSRTRCKTLQLDLLSRRQPADQMHQD